MYRMRQRGFVLDLLDGDAGAARDAARASRRRTSRRCSRRTRTRSGPSRPRSRTTCSASSSSSNGTAGGCAPRSPPPTGRRWAPAPSPAPAFPIDRDRTSALLGFDGPTGNTYGSIATVDYLLESLAAASVTLVGIGRVVQDLLLWCTAEFRYLRLGDGFVQVSSIMPQKRNPVALEHARSIGSKALGQAHGGDAERAQHAVRRHRRHRGRSAAARAARRSATRCARSSLVAASLRTATFDAAEMARRAARGVHHRHRAGRHADPRARPAVRAVARHRRRPRRGASRRAGAAAARAARSTCRPRVTGAAIDIDASRLCDILCPSHFVRVRRDARRPGAVRTAEAVRAADAALAARSSRGSPTARARLARADRDRRAALEAL